MPKQPQPLPDFTQEQVMFDAILVNVFAAASLIANGLGNGADCPGYHFDRAERLLAESKQRGYADLAALDIKTKGPTN